MESQVQSLKEDIEQLKSLSATNLRPRVEALIKNNISVLNSELSIIEASLSEAKSQSQKVQENQMEVKYEAIKGYSWDQENKFVKLPFSLIPEFI